MQTAGAASVRPENLSSNVVEFRPRASNLAHSWLATADLTPTGYAVGRFIAGKARFATAADVRRKVRPGEVFTHWAQRSIAAALKLSERQVRRGIANLRAAGFEVRRLPRPLPGTGDGVASYVFPSGQASGQASYQASYQASEENHVREPRSEPRQEPREEPAHARASDRPAGQPSERQQELALSLALEHGMSKTTLADVQALSLPELYQFIGTWKGRRKTGGHYGDSIATYMGKREAYASLSARRLTGEIVIPPKGRRQRKPEAKPEPAALPLEGSYDEDRARQAAERTEQMRRFAAENPTHFMAIAWKRQGLV